MKVYKVYLRYMTNTIIFIIYYVFITTKSFYSNSNILSYMAKLLQIGKNLYIPLEDGKREILLQGQGHSHHSVPKLRRSNMFPETYEKSK